MNDQLSTTRPKRYRGLRVLLFAVACLITLIILAYTVENWRGKRAWSKHVQHWQAQGERMKLAELVPPKVPDEKNFAMAPLLAPIFQYHHSPTGLVWLDTNGIARLEQISAQLAPKRETNDNLVLGSIDKNAYANVEEWAEFYRGNTNYPQAAADAGPAEIVLAALSGFDETLQVLREAAASRPYSRFPIEYEMEPSWAILLPHLQHIKRLTIFASVHAVASLEAGNAGQAFEDMKLGFRISDSISNEPLLIDHLVRIASLMVTLQTAREGIARGAWNEAQLKELQGWLAHIHLLEEYRNAIEGERAFTTSGLDWMRRQGFLARPGVMQEDFMGSEAAFFLRFMPSGWFYQNMRTLSDIHQRFFLRAVDAEAHRVFPAVAEEGRQAAEKLPRTAYTVFAKVLLPALDRALLRSAQAQVYVDAAITSCAVERYRLAGTQTPPSLQGLIPQFIDAVPSDVIDGKPLRWKSNPDGYSIYSIGWNLRDDGGEVEWKKQGKTIEATKGDWVWSINYR